MPSLKAIALESRLKPCRNVITMGVKPNFGDYAPQERALLRNASKIYYPSTGYADLFRAAGKAIFPSPSNYHFAQDKIMQTRLFQMLDIPHPPTRCFYGRRQQALIRDHYQYPFIAKIPRGSALGRGVFLIRNRSDLTAYLGRTPVAYIQQRLAVDRDFRIVVIGRKAVLAYRRVACGTDFRSNLACGASISLADIPEAAVDLALLTARRCGWDDVGIDICICDHRYYVLEGNMKYGRRGFAAAGIDYHRLMEKMIENGEI